MIFRMVDFSFVLSQCSAAKTTPVRKTGGLHTYRTERLPVRSLQNVDSGY